MDTSVCKIVNSVNKVLSLKEWEEISEAIRFADFWGLKRDNNSTGLDGSSLNVEGFKNEKYKVPLSPQYHVIYRWAANRYAIYDAFTLLLKFSGNTKGCIVQLH